MSQVITSIYIPRMSAIVTERHVINEFENFGIGKVSRVDFTPIDKKPGFGENVDMVVKSAFIHIEKYYYEHLRGEIVQNLKDGENHRIYPSCVPGEYWILLKAKSYVQSTMMNTSQIVENCRYLENIVTEQAVTISKLTNEIDNIKQVVYQLVGGLFCQETQKGMIYDYINTLYEKEIPDTDTDTHTDTHYWEDFPTTRQGDDCERRIAVLESQLQMLQFSADSNVFEDNTSEAMDISELNVENPEESYDNEETLSCQCAKLSLVIPEENYDYSELHKSIPRVYSSSDMSDDEINTTRVIFVPHSSSDSDDEYDMDCDKSLSSHSSMPELIPDTDSDNESGSRRRRIVSHELCGNE
jgi:hypothetical protein